VRHGSDVAKGVHVGHHIVAKATLVDRHALEVDVVEVRTHLVQRLVRNGHTQLLLRLGQRQPEPTPEPVTHLR